MYLKVPPKITSKMTDKIGKIGASEQLGTLLRVEDLFASFGLVQGKVERWKNYKVMFTLMTSQEFIFPKNIQKYLLYLS